MAKKRSCCWTVSKDVSDSDEYQYGDKLSLNQMLAAYHAMKLSIIILIVAIVGITALFVACKKHGVQTDVDAAVASGQFQFIALLDPEGNFTYPQVPGIPDWYFQGAGIRVRQTKPDTREADLSYMTSYNDALAQTLRTQGKFHVIEESVARAKANLDRQKQ